MTLKLSSLAALLFSLTVGCGGVEGPVPSTSDTDVGTESQSTEAESQSTEQDIMVCDTTWRRVSALCCGSGSPKTMWRRAVYESPHKCKVEYWCRPQAYACAI